MNNTNHWPLVELSEVAKDITVGFVGPMTQEYRDDGIVFLRSKNIKPFQIDLTDIRFINDSFHHKLSKSNLTPGDIVIVRTGTPGICAVIPIWLKNANCSDVVIIRPGPLLNSYFFAYYMNSIAVNHVDAYTVGAVQQHFNVGSTKKIKISLPSIEEQNDIVSILGALDDKIELNRQMNHTLEQMAQSLYKSWFVDFDPVVAKAAGKKPFGMSDEVAALFPDKFVDSLLGEIPEGWNIDYLSTFYLSKGGFAYKSKDFINAGNPLVKIRNINEDHTVDLSNVDYLPSEIAEKTKDFVLTDGDIVMAMTGATIGKFGIIASESFKQPLLNQRVAKFISKIKSEQLPIFLWGTLLSTDLYDYVVNTGGGSAQPNISNKQIDAYKLVIPPYHLVDQYISININVYTQLLNNLIESKYLEKLRDALLPRLLSGAIRLNKAEKIVSEAV